MASLTLKNIPDSVLDRLRERAAADRRSLTQEILFLLEEAMARPARGATPEEAARSQVRAWSALAGRWRSDRTPAQEVEELLAGRTPGRKIDL